jgi:hypothetical protein
MIDEINYISNLDNLSLTISNQNLSLTISNQNLSLSIYKVNIIEELSIYKVNIIEEFSEIETKINLNPNLYTLQEVSFYLLNIQETLKNLNIKNGFINNPDFSNTNDYSIISNLLFKILKLKEIKEDKTILNKYSDKTRIKVLFQDCIKDPSSYKIASLYK